MKIEAHDKFNKVIKSDITRLVVYDDQGNPVMIAFKQGPGMAYIARIGDKDFNNILKMLGITKTVILDTLEVDNTINQDVASIM